MGKWEIICLGLHFSLKRTKKGFYSDFKLNGEFVVTEEEVE